MSGNDIILTVSNIFSIFPRKLKKKCLLLRRHTRCLLISQSRSFNLIDSVHIGLVYLLCRYFNLGCDGVWMGNSGLPFGWIWQSSHIYFFSYNVTVIFHAMRLFFGCILDLYLCL